MNCRLPQSLATFHMPTTLLSKILLKEARARLNAILDGLQGGLIHSGSP